MVDAEAATEEVREAVVRAVGGLVGRKEVVLFVDRDREVLIDALRAAAPTAATLDTVSLLSRSAESGRAWALRYAEQLRARLPRAADEAGLHRFSARLRTLWWLTALSEKNTPGDPAWFVFSRLVAIESLLARPCDSAAVVAAAPLARPIEAIFSRRGIPVEVVELRAKSPAFWKRLARRFLGALTVPAAVRRSRRLRRDDPLDVAVLSDFPRSWTDRNGAWEDVYLADVVSHARREGCDARTVLVAFWPELRPGEHGSTIERLHRRPPDGPWEVLEGHASPWACAGRYLDPRDVWALVRAMRKPPFREAFESDGLDLYPLMAPLLVRSVVVWWPFLETLREAAAARARVGRVGAASCYLFEQAWGRALLEGFETSPETTLVGMQHGPYSRHKLQFGGMRSEWDASGGVRGAVAPDAIAAEGVGAAHLLEERGLDPATLHVTGPPRLDALARRIGKSLPDHVGPPPWRVLVAPGLHDMEDVVLATFRAFVDEPRVRLTVRLHPKAAVSARAALLAHPTAPREVDWSDARVEDLPSAVARSDLVVTTYSSAGVEAIAFGRPVILLASHRTADLSLFGLAGVASPTVSGATELRQSALRMLSDPKIYEAEVAAGKLAIQASFHTLDGQSARRHAQLLVRAASRREVSGEGLKKQNPPGQPERRGVP